MIFNYATILSSFDKRGTLMKQLQDMENAFDSAGLTGVEVVDSTATSLKLKFNFEDGTSMTTSAIDIKGAKGDTGDPATIAVGTVSTLPAGSSATVTNSGTASNAVFNFGIPKGDTGTAGGITNINGYTGAVTTGNGLSFNSGVLSAIDLNLTDTGTINVSTLTKPAEVTTATGTINYAFNSDHSIGKVYYYAQLTFGTISTAKHILIPLGKSVTPTGSAYYIQTGGVNWNMTDTQMWEHGHYCPQIHVSATGDLSIDIYVSTTASNKQVRMYYPACIYFFKDFGDTPDNRSFAMRMNAINNDPAESEVR